MYLLGKLEACFKLKRSERKHVITIIWKIDSDLLTITSVIWCYSAFAANELTVKANHIGINRTAAHRERTCSLSWVSLFAVIYPNKAFELREVESFCKRWFAQGAAQNNQTSFSVQHPLKKFVNWVSWHLQFLEMSSSLHRLMQTFAVWIKAKTAEKERNCNQLLR